MEISKSNILYLIKLIFTWTFLNVALNMLGLWFTKLLSPAEFSYLDSISNEFIKPLLIQSALFSLCFSVSYLFLKNKKLALYGFIALQFIVFHVIFFMNLKIHHGLYFVSTFKSFGVKYLSYYGQYLVDVLYLYFPVNGNFDNGEFIPANILTFYTHWILLDLLYYAGLIWLSIKTEKFFFGGIKKDAIAEQPKE